ncbi:hypothetical protein GUJ93_ZPchr0002g23053 [Zizania palustris]|uniref:Uncharacterized protein n=1 Tax=Zizania palustris TaxID=103762 RepID=A0A8J5VAA5_ZIZPA|nr:hypothetical protein GUJ93_ZPchr0002g23053 [Zizania palustris]
MGASPPSLAQPPWVALGGGGGGGPGWGIARCMMEGGREEAAMAMEVEAEANLCAGAGPPLPAPANSSYPSPNSIICSRQLGLKNTIQTNFGDDYVFQIASCQENSKLAVSLSTNALKFYCPATGQYLGECTGHSGTIHEISFSAPSSLHVVCSCSSDGTIRAWDTRSFKQISLLRAPQELFSFSYGGSNATTTISTYCCGEHEGEGLARVWAAAAAAAGMWAADATFARSGSWREEEDEQDALRWVALQRLPTVARARRGLLHGDDALCEVDVAGLSPSDRTALVDRLLADSGDAEHFFRCIRAHFDASVLLWDWRNSKQLACLEESHMDDVTQVKFAPYQQSKLISASVDGLMCVFDTDGDINEDDHLLSKLWCLSHIETLSTWDWNDGSRELNIEDARSLATDKWNLDHVDYFVDCHYSPLDDQLRVIGGTTAGTIGYFPVKYDLEGAIGSAEAILEGGHTDVVRTIHPAASTQNLGQNKGIFAWTGGEDGRLCCWRSDEIAEINNSWISASLVSRSQKRTTNIRHQPY